MSRPLSFCGGSAGRRTGSTFLLSAAGARDATTEDAAGTSRGLGCGRVTVAERFSTGPTSFPIASTDGLNTSCRSTYEVATDAQTMLTATVAT